MEAVMKKVSFFLICIPAVIFLSCVNGTYDPEGRWELNAKEIDQCEENDSFADAFEASQADLLYLNFYDDLFDYYLYHFTSGRSYTIKADVPFDHLSDTTIIIYDTSQNHITTSTAPADDERDSVIENFTATESNYYIVVVNTLSSGTGPLRGYMLTINED